MQALFLGVLTLSAHLTLFAASPKGVIGAPTFLSASGDEGTKATGMSALQPPGSADRAALQAVAGHAVDAGGIHNRKG